MFKVCSSHNDSKMYKDDKTMTSLGNDMTTKILRNDMIIIRHVNDIYDMKYIII